MTDVAFLCVCLVQLHEAEGVHIYSLMQPTQLAFAGPCIAVYSEYHTCHQCHRELCSGADYLHLRFTCSPTCFGALLIRLLDMLFGVLFDGSRGSCKLCTLLHPQP